MGKHNNMYKEYKHVYRHVLCIGICRDMCIVLCVDTFMGLCIDMLERRMDMWLHVFIDSVYRNEY